MAGSRAAFSSFSGGRELTEDSFWQLPPIKSGRPASDDLKQRRARAEQMMPPDATLVEQSIAGVRCFTASPAKPVATILYFHGGGYRMGNPASWGPFARRLSEAAQANVVLADYRLAPENPFPAGLQDAVAVYRALAQKGALFVAGDSAGGGLAAGLSIVARAAGAAPAGLIMISPMLDLTARNATYGTNAAKDMMFSKANVLECADLYLQGHPAEDPLVTPLAADPTAFPPAIILIGGNEVMLGEAIAFTERLALAGVEVTLHVGAGMAHIWPVLQPRTTQAADAVAMIGTFVRGITGNSA
jgi:monoterpene epsilon-lactone hydrolase